jgi:hypothetical protein
MPEEFSKSFNFPSSMANYCSNDFSAMIPSVSASPLTYLRRGFLDKPSEAFSSAAIESYRANVKDPACVHAMCEDYRASAPGGIDLTLDKEDLIAGKKIKAPFMVLWGAKGVVEAVFDCKKEWSVVCEGTVYGRSVPTGHYIPEGQKIHSSVG